MMIDGWLARTRYNPPPNTIEACADHCDVANRIETGVEEAYQLIESQRSRHQHQPGRVMDELLVEAIDKFVQPFHR